MVKLMLSLPFHILNLLPRIKDVGLILNYLGMTLNHMLHAQKFHFHKELFLMTYKILSYSYLASFAEEMSSLQLQISLLLFYQKNQLV